MENQINETERIVLVACKNEIVKCSGVSFGCVKNIDRGQLTESQFKGYLSQLVQKGLIEMVDGDKPNFKLTIEGCWCLRSKEFTSSEIELTKAIYLELPLHKSAKDLTEREWHNLGHEKANEMFGKMPLLERLEILLSLPRNIVSMCPYGNWIKTSKAELIQWYMNAKCTCSCGGHGKGQRNDNAVAEYLKLMDKYKIPVPPNEITYILGIYNGEGSF